MRNLLILLITLLSSFLSPAQDDFRTLDKKSYEYFLKGDYRNLKRTGNRMLSKGIDYYYLRLRLGVLSFNRERYAAANRHFSRLVEWNPADTLSHEYNFFSYKFSGRSADAMTYLAKLTNKQKSKTLKSIETKGITALSVGGLVSSYDRVELPFQPPLGQNLSYESPDMAYGGDLSLEALMSEKLKLNVGYTYLKKSGTLYNDVFQQGEDLNLKQNQVFALLTSTAKRGWEYSFFGSGAFYSGAATTTKAGQNRYFLNIYSEYLGGVGVSKKGWFVRGSVNASVSNLGGSKQARGEAAISYFPVSNLNLYFTAGSMLQYDTNWGETYQVNGELGFRVFKYLWVEGGAVMGNAFLYARGFGSSINNSYQVPDQILFANLIIPFSKVHVKFMAFKNENTNYLWDLDAFTRQGPLGVNSSGFLVKLTLNLK